MNYLLSCFAALQISCCTLHAQTDKIIHFGVHINPKYSMPILKHSDLIFPENTFNYSFGIDIFYDANSSVQLYSGLNFSRLSGEQIDYSLIFACDFNAPEVNRNSWFEDVFTIHYLGIPIGSKFKLVGEENHLYVKIGLEPMFKVNSIAESYLIECDPPGRLTAGNPFTMANSLVLNSKLGLGIEFALSKKIKLIIEPEIEYTLNTIFEDVTISAEDLHEQRILNAGIIIGARF